MSSEERLQDLVRDAVRQGRAPKATLEQLVQHESQDPGWVHRFMHHLWTRPDGPLKDVTEPTELARIADTAEARWNVTAERIDPPRNLAGLIALLEHARDTGIQLRFSGSARSLSNVSQPAATGHLVATAAYGRALDLDAPTLRDGVDASALYRAEAGRVLADVLLDLTSSGRCLADMGSGDFQTLAGALSTSTHGSGVQHGAFPALVQSLDVVAYDPAGQVIVQRIERADGPTDPERFATWVAGQDVPVQLVQDDEVFLAWTVSIGCLGAIYSVTLSTVPRYWLQETRTVAWWSDVKQALEGDVNRVDYYEILLATWPTRNGDVLDHRCLVTRRLKVSAPPGDRPVGGRPETMAVAQTLLGHLATEVTTCWALRNPLERIAVPQKTGITASVVPADAPYTDRDVEILLLRLDINAVSSELAIPLARHPDGRVDPSAAIAAAIDILAADASNREGMANLIGTWSPIWLDNADLLQAWREFPLHVSPIALRFVAADDALLSMQYGGPCCMIEMPMPGADAYDRDLVDPPEHPSREENLYAAYDVGRQKLFRDREQHLVTTYGARPHWGQVHFMDWGRTAQVYPQASVWRRIYERYNALGVFDGPVTDQLGISMGGPA